MKRFIGIKEKEASIKEISESENAINNLPVARNEVVPEDIGKG
jgi:hypothetical protein